MSEPTANTTNTDGSLTEPAPGPNANSSSTASGNATGIAVPDAQLPTAPSNEAENVGPSAGDPVANTNTAEVVVPNGQGSTGVVDTTDKNPASGSVSKPSQAGIGIVLPPGGLPPVVQPPAKEPAGSQPLEGPPLIKDNVPGFLHQLVESLKEFFDPGGDQIFTLQFPGRFLSQDLYAWDTQRAGIYGQFVKPVAVNESEFRLADQLYDIADNVGGPNATNLSIVYEQLLNNFLPKYVDNGLQKQQNQIRKWLMQDVPMSPWIKDMMERQNQREKNASGAESASISKVFDISSKNIAAGDTLNRIELSGLLMNEYLYAKQDWELERDEMINEATEADIGDPETQKKLNSLTRKLAHITATRQAQLASKYNDAVVRGYTHTIKDYMGYMDIASSSEALQNAKDSLREAAMSSLDGAMKIYPIQFTPLDWFEGLSTSFTMEDLTQDPEMLRMQIDAKSQQLDNLNSQLAILQLGAKGDPKELEKQVADAQRALDKAQSDLARAFTSNVIAMAKTCLDAQRKLDRVALKNKVDIADAAIDQLEQGMEKVSAGQDTLTAASRALSQLYAALALAEATDTKQAQQFITIQIQTLTRELNELQTRWTVLTAQTGGVNPPSDGGPSEEDVETVSMELPVSRTSGGGRWQELHLTSDETTRDQLSGGGSSSVVHGSSCNFWVGSRGTGNSSASGTSYSQEAATSAKIELALRCTLVTIDRGGWFQPQFFKLSKAFYKVNPEITWTKPHPTDDKKVDGLMPGFPVAFVVAKDIMIRVSYSGSEFESQKEFHTASSTKSGGFLCFSKSTSTSSSSESQSSSFKAYSNGFTVKIPGPQILGYMIQTTPPDESEPMPRELPDNFFIPEEDYNPGRNSEVVTGPSAGTGKERAKEGPSVSVDRLREVISRILDERLDVIFDLIKDEATKLAGASTSAAT